MHFSNNCMHAPDTVLSHVIFRLLCKGLAVTDLSKQSLISYSFIRETLKNSTCHEEDTCVVDIEYFHLSQTSYFCKTPLLTCHVHYHPSHWSMYWLYLSRLMSVAYCHWHILHENLPNRTRLQNKGELADETALHQNKNPLILIRGWDNFNEISLKFESLRTVLPDCFTCRDTY